MNDRSPEISEIVRQAIAKGDWAQVNWCAMEIAKNAPNNPDAPFLMGLAQKAAQKHDIAAEYFAKALSLSAARYDAAIELARQNILLNRHSVARELLDQYSEKLQENSHYLDMAGEA
jgi:Tfp pilus assembly protein PilF